MVSSWILWAESQFQWISIWVEKTSISAARFGLGWSQSRFMMQDLDLGSEEFNFWCSSLATSSQGPMMEHRAGMRGSLGSRCWCMSLVTTWRRQCIIQGASLIAWDFSSMTNLDWLVALCFSFFSQKYALPIDWLVCKKIQNWIFHICIICTALEKK